jgi:hypothetical protein
MTIQVIGLDKVYQKMEKLAGSKIADDTMKAYAILVQGDVTPYPDKTEANYPPPPYYERGKGVVGATKILKTSENLHDKWKLKTGSRVILENTASYSGFVQGLKQAKFHADRGWKNAYKRADEMIDQLHKIFHRLFEKQWR